MQIDKQVIDEVNLTLTVELNESDYKDKVEKSLKDYRKKANIPGFRKGNVPMGLIKKMYGKSVLFSEAQELASSSLFDYIKENELDVLGQPLPAENQSPEDIEKDGVFHFAYDVALSPVLDFPLNKRDSIPYYNIEISDEMEDSQIKNMISRVGNYVNVDKSEEKDIIKGRLIEVFSDGTVGVEGISNEDGMIMPSYVKDKDEQKKFIGLGVGDTVTFNPAKAYENNDAEIASLLHIDKEKAKDLNSDFSFEVKEITRYEEAELNQETFDKVLGKDVVKSEEEFRAHVKEGLEKQLAMESDYRFMIDAKEMFLRKKAAGLKFPEKALKRWLAVSSKDGKKKPEDFASQMPAMIEDLKWQLIKEKLVKDNNLEVSEEVINNTAKDITRAQFAQYGMGSVPDDLLENYAKELLSKEESKRNVLDQAMSKAIGAFLKTAVKIKEQSISMEEFGKLYENKK